MACLVAGAARSGAIGLLLLAAGAAEAAGLDEEVSAYQGDPARGESAFAVCAPCHAVGLEATHHTGPSLNRLFGRRAGAAPGYASSMPMVYAGMNGLVWTDESLFAFLSDPQSVAPGNEMPLIGVFDPQTRADLIAYLHLATSDPQD